MSTETTGELLDQAQRALLKIQQFQSDYDTDPETFGKEQIAEIRALKRFVSETFETVARSTMKPLAIELVRPKQILKRIRRHTNTTMISISLPVTTLEKIDQRSQELGITRSRALSEALDLLMEEGKL